MAWKQIPGSLANKPQYIFVQLLSKPSASRTQEIKPLPQI